jgi:hypothetical protein
MTWQTVVKRILEQESSLDRIGTLSSLTEEVRLKGVRRMLRGGTENRYSSDPLLQSSPEWRIVHVD